MNTPDTAELTDLACQLGTQLLHHEITMAAAESCTGGLIGHLITETPGCSEYFMGSAVVYSYDAKETVLHVEREIIVASGAVSEEVATQMAHGSLALYEVDFAVAVTGIAGPNGGTDDKPVGTVHIHLSAVDGYEKSRHHVWQSDRTGNKMLSAQSALTMALEYLAQRERN